MPQTCWVLPMGMETGGGTTQCFATSQPQPAAETMRASLEHMLGLQMFMKQKPLVFPMSFGTMFLLLLLLL